MAFLKRSSRGLWLPGGQPKIDWTNPITAGLVGCWVATGEGGPVPIIRDLVTGQILLRTAGTAFMSSGSIGMQANDVAAGGTGGGWGYITPETQKPASEVSMLWFGSITSSSGAFPPFIGSEFGNQNTAPHACFNLSRNNGANTQPIIAWNVNGVQSTLGLSSFDSTTSGNYCILATMKTGATIRVFKKGIMTNSAAVSAGTISYQGVGQDTFCIGAYAASAVQAGNAGGKLCVGALWNRQLTHGESALISSDPTNFLIFPGDQSLPPVIVGKLSAALAAALAAAATTSAALTTAIQLSSAPAAASVVTAAMSTSIRLTAALASASTVAANLTTGIVLAATSASVAAATAAVTTGINLATGLASAISSAAGSLTTAIRLAAAMAAQALGVADLSVSAVPHVVSPHLAVRRRMIARKGRDIILRHGGQTFTDTSFRAFVHAFSAREITEGLKQGGQRVETLADVTPIVGDKLLIGGKVFNVLGAGVIYDGDTLLGYSLLVRG